MMTASKTAASEAVGEGSLEPKESLSLSNGTSITTPTSSKFDANTENVKTLAKRFQPEVECIDLDDDGDDDIVIEKVSKGTDIAPPSAKRKRLHDKSSSPVPEDPKTNSGLVDKEVTLQ